ncbi:MAG: hypothetical protein HY764_01715 [Candidatus Portnoybacteria bacterium]|nr:hypothetical protein [Candidatus Portnoybacteria bacterium]
MKKYYLLLMLVAFGFILVPHSAYAIGEQTSFLFRLYNPQTEDHFYTPSESEKNSALTKGYIDEGTSGTIFSVSTSTGLMVASLQRLFNPISGDHFYTTSTQEANAAISQAGYLSEGSVGFVALDQSAGLIPLFRMFNPATKDHFYTTDIIERLRTAERHGYVFEGVIGYINERIFNLVRSANIQENQQIASPLIITGEARGLWFFEASFPVILLDDKGRVMAQGFAQTSQDWMTSNFVSFTSIPIVFESPSDTNKGFLILEKDNPSDLPKFDDQLAIPVNF